MGAFADKMRAKYPASPPRPGSFAERMRAKYPEQPQGPGLAARVGMGAVRSIPGVGTAADWQDMTGAERAGSIAGDVGSAAGLVATGGLPAAVKALGLGATVGGALAPLAQKVQQASQATEGAITSRMPGAGSQSQAVQFARQIPGNIAGTVVESIPSLATMALLGKAINRVGGARAPMGTPATRQLAGQAEQMGIPVTRAAVVPGSTAEAKFKTSPTGQEFYKGQREGITGALKVRAGEAATATPGEIGQQITQRGGQGFADAGDVYKAVQAETFALPYEKGVGTRASRQIAGYLEAQKFKVAQGKGGEVKRSPFTGNELISDPATADVITDTMQRVRTAKSLEDLVQQRRAFDKQIEKVWAENPNPERHHKVAVREIINQSIYDEIARKNGQAAAGKWRQANEDYGKVADAFDEVARASKKSPEKVFDAILTGGTDTIEGAKRMVGPQVVEQAAFNKLLGQSLEAQTGQVSIERLKTAWNKPGFQDQKRSLFTPETARWIDNYIKVVDFAEAPQAVAGLTKRGGAQTEPRLRIDMAQAAKLLATGGGGVAFGWPGAVAAGVGALAAPAVQAARAKRLYYPQPGFYEGKPGVVGKPSLGIAAAMAARNQTENRNGR